MAVSFYIPTKNVYEFHLLTNSPTFGVLVLLILAKVGGL